MNKVYIVAKVTGLSDEIVALKYERAKQLVRSFGYEPVSPIDYIPANTPWHTAMRICIPLMLSCDAYTVIDDLHTTTGGLIEDTIAYWTNFPRLQFSKI